MKLAWAVLATCVGSSSALAFSGLNLDRESPCRVEPIREELGPSAKVLIDGNALKFTMTGVTLSAKVICHHEKQLGRVGYVQFILDGTSKAAYKDGTLHIRFAKTPIIDTYESILPWYEFEILNAAGNQAAFRMTDHPGGTLPVYSPMRPSSKINSGITPDLEFIERSLRFLSILGYYDPDKEVFLPLRVHEWATRLRMERFEEAGKPPSFKLAAASADGPTVLGKDQLRELAPKLKFEPPSGLAATEYWWSQEHSLREIKLPMPPAHKRSLER